MAAVGVDCLFEANGRLRIRRIEQNGRWQAVEQGRQWQDERGRHVLIMLPGQLPQELLLRGDGLTWELLGENGRSSDIHLA
jgi:hypothetical protein